MIFINYKLSKSAKIVVVCDVYAFVYNYQWYIDSTEYEKAYLALLAFLKQIHNPQN